MWKAALAGALLATIGSTFALADGYEPFPSRPQTPARVSPPATRATPAQAGTPAQRPLAAETPVTTHSTYAAASMQPSFSAVDSHIAQFKSALRLTAEQERHWPRVEVALREVVQGSNSDDSNSHGLIRRIGSRASDFVFSANAIRRLVAAAQPLIKSLDPQQKHDALALARHMGFASVAEQFE